MLFYALEAPKGAIVKTCRCGRAYDADAWLDLPICGLMEGFNDYTMLDLRNCPCMSTIAVEVPLCVNPRVGLTREVGLQSLLSYAFRNRTTLPAPPAFLKEVSDGC